MVVAEEGAVFMVHVAASAGFVGGMFVLAAVVNRFYDAPVREYLKRKIAPWPGRNAVAEFQEYEAEVR